MTVCPYCGCKTFCAEATPVRKDESGIDDAYINICKGCGKESVYCSRKDKQIPAEEWDE